VLYGFDATLRKSSRNQNAGRIVSSVRISEANDQHAVCSLSLHATLDMSVAEQQPSVLAASEFNRLITALL
jgi:hypothetical protein